MKRIVVCCIEHPEHENLFLHFQRSDTGKYTTPAGHAEDGESIEQAALREMQEEAGIDPKDVKDVKVIRNQVAADKNGQDLDLYLVDIKFDKAPIVNGTGDIDAEPVPGTFCWLNPLLTDKELHVPRENNILVQQLEEKVGKLGKSEKKDRKDRISGGLADRKKPKDFDKKALKRGVKVEMEHTDDSDIALEIAMDHLVEDPEYYEKLSTIKEPQRGLSKARDDWKKEGYSLRHKKDKHGFHNVYAYDKNGKQVGIAKFSYYLEPDQNNTSLEIKGLKGWELQVDPEHRRKGLATAMYKLAEEKSGLKIKPGVLTDMGEIFWSQKNREFGENQTQKIELSELLTNQACMSADEQMSAAMSSDLSPQMWIMLASSSLLPVREIIANREDIPYSIQKLLVKKPENHVFLSQNPHISEDIVLELIANPKTHLNLIKYQDLHTVHLGMLAQSPIPLVQELVAMDKHTPVAVLRDMINKGNPSVLSAILLNKSLAHNPFFTQEDLDSIVEKIQFSKEEPEWFLSDMFMSHPQSALKNWDHPNEHIRAATVKSTISHKLKQPIDYLKRDISKGEIKELGFNAKDFLLSSDIDLMIEKSKEVLTKDEAHDVFIVSLGDKLDSNQIDRILKLYPVPDYLLGLLVSKNESISGPILRLIYDKVNLFKDTNIGPEDPSIFCIINILLHKNCPPDIIREVWATANPVFESACVMAPNCPSDVKDQAAALGLQKSELKKMARPILKFPKILPSETRPETQIREVPSTSVHFGSNRVPMRTPKGVEATARLMAQNFISQNKPIYGKKWDDSTRAQIKDKFKEYVSHPGIAGAVVQGQSGTSNTRPIGYAHTDKPKSLEPIKAHEGMHRLFGLVAQKHGKHARQALVEHLLSHFDSHAKDFLSGVLSQQDRYGSNPEPEEVLIAARDITALPTRKKDAMNYYLSHAHKTGLDYEDIISRVKRGWQKAYEAARDITPEKLKELANEKLKADLIAQNPMAFYKKT
jgi:8-oxo-dGTP pyrophosphatase MutT (NUDIX family)/GNAT superfamily N-acetyltransferase